MASLIPIGSRASPMKLQLKAKCGQFRKKILELLNQYFIKTKKNYPQQIHTKYKIVSLVLAVPPGGRMSVCVWSSVPLRALQYNFSSICIYNSISEESVVTLSEYCDLGGNLCVFGGYGGYFFVTGLPTLV